MDIKGTCSEVTIFLIVNYDDESRRPMLEFDLWIYDRVGRYSSIGAMCAGREREKEKILEACRDVCFKTTGSVRTMISKGIAHVEHALAYI